MKQTELTIPEETARRLIEHPWASRLLPNIQREWLLNKKTGKLVFRARMPESRLQEFLEALKLLEPTTP